MTSVGTGVGTAGVAETAAGRAVETAATGIDGHPQLAIVFAATRYDYRRVVETVRAETDRAPLVGCSTAGEFTGAGPTDGSVTVTLVAGEEFEAHVGLGEELSADPEAAVAAAADPLPPVADDDRHHVGINLHDGLLGRGEEIAMLGYQQRPVPYVGGSAADDFAMSETVVFANDEVATDAVVLASLVADRPFGRAVDHGHEPFGDSLTVTDADGSVVETLNGRPAFEVWRETVEQRATGVGVDLDGLSPDDDAFEELLTRFEFGLETGDDEFKIRWPGLTRTTEGPLRFATQIPEGTELFVVDSDTEAQLDTARRVTEAAVAPVDPAGGVAFDCICQGLVLGDEFGTAVEQMSETLSAPIAGVQTYGEVAVAPDDMRAYHNTTTSLLVFPE
ncbi:MAG: hypothetical protein J07HB67_01403 [halophilic archaeon J07HB67]|jgi:Uncharacterized conserved protein|nr:MAG: hypothetical protein J07HB67_01403 [halophilic archaeon J07HB67]